MTFLKHSYRLIRLMLLVGFLGWAGCRKADLYEQYNTNESQSVAIKKFFDLDGATNPQGQRAASLIKNHFEKNKIDVSGLITTKGSPKWNHVLAYRLSKPVNGAGRSAARQSNSADSILIIPMVQSTDTAVETSLYLHFIAGTDTIKQFSVLDADSYDVFINSTNSSIERKAESYAMMFMKLSSNVFNTKQFLLTDNRLFRSPASDTFQNMPKRSVKFQNRANALFSSDFECVDIFYSSSIWVCTTPSHSGCSDADGCDHCGGLCYEVVSWTYSESICTPVFTSGGGGGGGSGGGSGGGGGGGGSNPNVPPPTPWDPNSPKNPGWKPLTISWNAIEQLILPHLDINETIQPIQTMEPFAPVFQDVQSFLDYRNELINKILMDPGPYDDVTAISPQQKRLRLTTTFGSVPGTGIKHIIDLEKNQTSQIWSVKTVTHTPFGFSAFWSIQDLGFIQSTSNGKVILEFDLVFKTQSEIGGHITLWSKLLSIKVVINQLTGEAISINRIP